MLRRGLHDVGVFEKLGGGETFALTAYIPTRPERTAEEAIANIRERVGWELEVARTLPKAEPIATDELTLARMFGPEGSYLRSGMCRQNAGW